jgi:Holliday junction resolvase RusA-like endonuclease
MVDRPLAQAWRRRISNEIVKAISEEVAGGRRALLAGYPIAGPVEVTTYFTFVRSSGDDAEEPTNRMYGDGDTLTRCVWDALTDAKCIGDDSLVISWTGSKRFGEREGVLIRVWAIDELFT